MISTDILFGNMVMNIMLAMNVICLRYVRMCNCVWLVFFHFV